MAPIQTYQTAPLNADGSTPHAMATDSESQRCPASAANDLPQPTRSVSLLPISTRDLSDPLPPRPGAQPQSGPSPTLYHRRRMSTPAAAVPVPNPNYAAPPFTPTPSTPTTPTTQPPPPQTSWSAAAPRHAPSKSTVAVPPPPRSVPQSATQAHFPSPRSPASPSHVSFDEESFHRGSLEHPPGYRQNPYAADGTAEQRARLLAAAEKENESNDDLWGNLKRVSRDLSKYAQQIEKGAWEWIDGKRDPGSF